MTRLHHPARSTFWHPQTRGAGPRSFPHRALSSSRHLGPRKTAQPPIAPHATAPQRGSMTRTRHPPGSTFCTLRHPPRARRRATDQQTSRQATSSAAQTGAGFHAPTATTAGQQRYLAAVVALGTGRKRTRQHSHQHYRQPAPPRVKTGAAKKFDGIFDGIFSGRNQKTLYPCGFAEVI